MNRRELRDGFTDQRIIVVPRPILAASLQHSLLKHLLPTDAGVFPKAKNHRCVREEGCPETVFIYCANGEGWCEMAGLTHEIKKDQLLIIPAGVPHIYGAAKENPWSIRWFHAIGSNIPAYLEILGVTTSKPVVKLGGNVQLFSLFEDVMEGLEHGFTLTHLIYSAHSLSHLMGLILRHKNEHFQETVDTADRVAKSVEFMKAHLSENLKINTLAALVNLSVSHYRSLFRQVTGHAPLSYFIHLRMQRAAELLNSTTLPVKEISMNLGYADQLYFSRQFRAIHDHSPSEHRQLHKA